MTAGVQPPIKEALDAFIENRGAGRSVLDAALGDARAARDHQILWLMTLGYLIVSELIGSTIAKPSTAFPIRSSPRSDFLPGLPSSHRRPCRQRTPRRCGGFAAQSATSTAYRRPTRVRAAPTSGSPCTRKDPSFGRPTSRGMERPSRCPTTTSPPGGATRRQ